MQLGSPTPDDSSNPLSTGQMPSKPNPFDDARLDKNRQEFLSDSRYSSVAVDDIHATWATFHLAVHGTTPERALQIISDGRIASYATLAKDKPEIIRDSQSVNTDTLDIALGLDRFVFLNLGRVHPLHIHPVYFIFPNKLVEQAGAIASLREIVHFGALVSPEAAAFAQRADRTLTTEKIEAINSNAADQFFRNCFRGSQFISDIFPRFIQQEFPNMIHYSSSFLYPGTEPILVKVGNEATLRNTWEGPQIMIPDHISLAQYQTAILITQHNPSLIRALLAAGIPREKIFSMDEVIKTYDQAIGLGDYTSQRNQYAYLNLALRDIALLAEYNHAQESFPDSMNGFKNRI